MKRDKMEYNKIRAMRLKFKKKKEQRNKGEHDDVKRKNGDSVE